MTKMVRDINTSHAVNVLHIRDIPHLLHNAIVGALDHVECKKAVNIAMKLAAIFKYAGKVKAEFLDICQEFEVTPKRIRTIMPARWFTYRNCINDIVEFWNVLIALLERSTGNGAKIDNLKKQLEIDCESDIDKQEIYATLLVLSDVLNVIHPLRVEIEVKYFPPFRCFELFSQVQSVIQSLSSTSFESPRTKAILSASSPAVRLKARNSTKIFVQTFQQKWEATCSRNLDTPQDGAQMKLCELSQIVNPEKKSTVSQVFREYRELFGTVHVEITDDLEKEFAVYLQERTRLESDPLKYWISAEKDYPQLSTAGFRIMAVPSCSIEIERSFSKMGYVQRPERNRMNEESILQSLMLFVNKGTVPLDNGAN